MRKNQKIRLKFCPTAFINFTTCMFLSACSKTGHPPFPYKAQVIHYIPPAGSLSGRWNISEQTLPTMEDPDSARGKFFEILTGRNLEIDSTVGSIVSGKISGGVSKNSLRYTLKNGVMVPRDTTTLMIFSSFHAFEQVFENIEPATGLNPEVLKQTLGGRYQIFFEPTIEVMDGQSETRISPKTNAAFNPDGNNFILFRRSSVEDVPLAANTKVIAHEFGHALFKNSFFRQKNESCTKADAAQAENRKNDKFFEGRMGLEFAMSGFNEGYSDFVSYIMTGDVNALEGGVTADEIAARSLEGKPFFFYQLAGDTACSGTFYCVGTLFARALYKAASVHPRQSAGQLAFSRKVFNALGTAESFLRQEPSLSLWPDTTAEMAQCERRNSFLLSHDGKVSSAFLAAFVRGFPADADKTALCSALVELFGTAGFANDARSACES